MAHNGEETTGDVSPDVVVLC